MDGIEAVKLVLAQSLPGLPALTQTLWVDPSTYLPVG